MPIPLIIPAAAVITLTVKYLLRDKAFTGNEKRLVRETNQSVLSHQNMLKQLQQANKSVVSHQNMMLQLEKTNQRNIEQAIEAEKQYFKRTSEMKADLSSLKSEQQQMKMDKQQLDIEVISIQDRITSEKESLNALLEKNTQLNNEKQKAVNLIDDLQKQFKQDEEENESKIHFLENKISTLKYDREDLLTNTKELSDDLIKLQAETTSTYTKLSEDSRDYEILKMKKSTLEKNTVKAHEEFLNVKNESNTKIIAINKSISELKEQEDILNHDISLLQTNKSKLETEVNEQDKKNEGLIYTVNELTKRSDQMRGEIEAQRKQLTGDMERTINTEKELALSKIDLWIEKEKDNYSDLLKSQYEEQATKIRDELSDKVRDEFNQIHSYFSQFSMEQKQMAEEDIRTFLDKKRSDIISRLQ